MMMNAGQLRLVTADERPTPTTTEQAQLAAAAELLERTQENIRQWLVWYRVAQQDWQTG